MGAFEVETAQLGPERDRIAVAVRPALHRLGHLQGGQATDPSIAPLVARALDALAAELRAASLRLDGRSEGLMAGLENARTGYAAVERSVSHAMSGRR